MVREGVRLIRARKGVGDRRIKRTKKGTSSGEQRRYNSEAIWLASMTTDNKGSQVVREKGPKNVENAPREETKKKTVKERQNSPLAQP